MYNLKKIEFNDEKLQGTFETKFIELSRLYDYLNINIFEGYEKIIHKLKIHEIKIKGIVLMNNFEYYSYIDFNDSQIIDQTNLIPHTYFPLYSMSNTIISFKFIKKNNDKPIYIILKNTRMDNPQEIEVKCDKFDQYFEGTINESGLIKLNNIVPHYRGNLKDIDLINQKPIITAIQFSGEFSYL